MPCLSIIVPTYNRAPFLEITLAALAPQVALLSAEDVEVHIVDNESTDNTTEVCARYPQFTYFRNSPMRTVFVGMQRLTGSYIWIVCDDDFIHENAVPTLVQLIKEAGQARPIFLLNYAQVDKTGSRVLSSGVCGFDLPDFFPTLGDFMPVDGSFDILGFLPAAVFPREPILASHFELFASLKSSYDFVGALLEAFYRSPAIYIAVPLLTQRQGNQRTGESYDQSTQTVSVSAFVGILQMFQLLEDRFGVPMEQTLKMRQRAVLGTNAPCTNVINYFIDTYLKPSLLGRLNRPDDADLTTVLSFVDRLADRQAARRINILVRLTRSISDSVQALLNS